MMNRIHIAVLALTLAAGSIGPTAAWAQDAPSSEAIEVDREMMTRFVRAHLEINDARDEFHGKVARVHDAEGRARAREEVEARITSVLEAQEMTREQYDQVILMISLDGDMRAMFEEVVIELQQERNGDR